MQPYIFPYIGYYQLISTVEKFVIYDDVNYINKGWINRNNLLINGKAGLFSVPLKDASQNRLINEIELANEPGWKTKFLKTIEHAYKKAPYYQPVLQLINNVIDRDVSNINQLASLSLRTVCDYLAISTTFIQTSSQYNNNHLKAQNRILDICKIEKTDHYINPIGGIEIYSKEFFEASGIKIDFLKTCGIEYKQFANEFVPNLSILDVLMFNSVQEVQQLLTQYQLV